jgi:hypothetical protein
MPRRYIGVLVIALSALACYSSVSLHSQAKRPMTLVDLLNIPRTADPQLSPDGRAITFMLTTPDWKANRRVAHLWRINTDGQMVT